MSTRRFGNGGGGPGSAAVCSGEVFDGANVERILALVDMGALVSLSRSRDGGACGCTVTVDGKWERQWFRDAAQAALQLDEWLGLVEDAKAATPPPAQGQRPLRPA